MTTTGQLEARNSNVPGFLGVFAANQLPAVPNAKNHPQGFCLIANYSSIDDPRGGTHWVAFAGLNSGGPVRFFDSYGEPPDSDDGVLRTDTHFQKFAEHHSLGPVQWNKYDLQAIEDNLNSGTCGEWSSFFLHTGGVLPKLGDGRHFLQPWERFQDARILGPVKSIYQLRGLTLGPQQEKDEDVAKQNDRMVRAWAQIIPAK